MKAQSQKHETTIRERDWQLKDANERIEQLNLTVIANSNAAATAGDIKTTEFLNRISKLEAKMNEKETKIVEAR